MSSRSPVAVNAAELRAAFDRTRGAPFRSGEQEQTENLLAIRVSRDAYAIKMTEISGLAKHRKIVAFPGPVSELLGVAGIRGALVPVYSLAALLGYGAEAGQVCWLALCGTDEPLALAFNAFEGYVQIPSGRLYSAGQNDATRRCVTHVARAADTVRAVISIPLIREAIQERCRSGSVPKER